MKPVICPNRCKVIHRQNLASMRDSGRFCEKIANTRKVLRKIRKKKGRRVKGTPAGFPQRFASAPPPATPAGLRPRAPTPAAKGTTQAGLRPESKHPKRGTRRAAAQPPCPKRAPAQHAELPTTVWPGKKAKQPFPLRSHGFAINTAPEMPPPRPHSTRQPLQNRGQGHGQYQSQNARHGPQIALAHAPS